MHTTYSTPTRLVDRFDRHVNYVRISVTDRCDFRCVYCMSENMTFVARAEVLKAGRSLTVTRGEVLADGGALCAVMQQTLMMLPDTPDTPE